MPDPTETIEQLAVQNVVDTINGIVEGEQVTTERGQTYTFQNTLVVAPYNPDGVPTKDGTVEVVPGKQVMLAKQAAGKDDYWLVLVIVTYATAQRFPDGSTPPVEERLRLIASEIKLALGVDVRRGGYAGNTVFAREGDGAEIVLDGVPSPAVVMPLLLMIRTGRNNPFVQ